MERIGLYSQIKEFSSANAGTAEWCIAERDGRKYFVKKFHSPVYPSKEIGLPEKMYAASAAEFKETMAFRKEIYRRLRSCDQSGILVIPEEIISYQFHICTIAEYISANVSPGQVCSLSEWQRLVLLRTLTLALMNVHEAGVVHSDMKPENVMMTQDAEGNCKLRLIDFDGSFLEEKPPADAEEVVGDPTYFAPEAYRMSMEEEIRLDHRIDIFALGIIFHYFWCGKLPDKPEDQTIGECLLRGGTVQLDESVPPVLKQLILKMIQADPEERISLKSVYDVLGIQVGLYPPTIVRLPTDSEGKPPASRHTPSPTPPRPAEDAEKKREVRINFCGEDGEILQYRTLMLPYGSKKVIEAEEIAGYHLKGLKTKEIVVNSEGYTVSPVTFSYAKNKPGSSKKHVGRNVFLILLGIFSIYWGSMYVLSMQAHNEGHYDSARVYMKAMPLFKQLFSSAYEANQRGLAGTASLGSKRLSVWAGETQWVKFTAPVAGTYRFTTTGSDDTWGTLYSSVSDPSAIMENNNSGDGKNFLMDYYLEANQEIYVGVRYYSSTMSGTVTLNIQKLNNASRTFEINETVGMNKGRATVSWTDSADASPYIVYFQPIGRGGAVQASEWGGGSREESTATAKQLALTRLIPGHQYRIYVEDCNGVSTNRDITLPEAHTFSDGSFKASSISVQLDFRKKDDSASDTTAVETGSLRASEILRDRGKTEYGFAYTVNYPRSLLSSYLTQILITAPNGFFAQEYALDVKYEGYGGLMWYMLGDDTFRKFYDQYSTIPAGAWKIDLFWDGMHVNQSTFSVL